MQHLLLYRIVELNSAGASNRARRNDLLSQCGPRTGSSGGLGCFPEGFARRLHLLFECFPGGLPGLLFERYITTAVTFARVLSGIFAATALALARVLPFARMRIHGGAVAHARARIVPAFGLAFACVQAATNVLFPQQQGGIVLVISFSRMALQGSAQHHAAKGSHRQFAKVAPRQGCVSNYSSLLHVHSFLRLMIFKTMHTSCAVHPSISPGFDSSRREILQNLAGSSKSPRLAKPRATQSGGPMEDHGCS